MFRCSLGVHTKATFRNIFEERGSLYFFCSVFIQTLSKATDSDYSNMSFRHPLVSTVTSVVDQCLSQTAGCEHYCVSAWGSYECFCRPGFRLEQDKRSCTREYPHDPLVDGLSLQRLPMHDNSDSFNAMLWYTSSAAEDYS